MYRQGDILIKPIQRLPPNMEPVCRDPSYRLVLAYGEQTGHAHAIISTNAALYCTRGNDASMYLEITSGKPAELRHEEHGVIMLPVGAYQIVRQREYTPEAIREVAD